MTRKTPKILPALFSAAFCLGGGILSAQAGMVAIKGGTFLMGSPDFEFWRKAEESPRTSVTLGPFLISDHEVTFEEYDEFSAATGSRRPADESWGRASRPVINVMWYEAVAYCNWRSSKDGLEPAYQIEQSSVGNPVVSLDRYKSGYRLPTEAEWEYACRAGTLGPFSFGASISGEEANFDGNYPYGDARAVPLLGKTSPVRSYAANAFGLYDMHGNVWEWCWDYYGEYLGGDVSDPLGAAWDSRRVARGGSWISGGNALRSAKRGAYPPEFFSSTVGFRVARTDPSTKRPDAASVAAKSGSVTVRTEPYGRAEVYIDGKKAGNSPDVFPLADGAHEIVVKARSLGKDFIGSAKVVTREGFDERIVIKLLEDIKVPAGMALIQAGSFFMGSPQGEAGRMTDEGPQHTVQLSAFFIGAYETTFEEYDAFCAATSRPLPSDEGWGRGRRPAVNVSWLDAVLYCNWRSQREKLDPVYVVTGVDVRFDKKKNGYRLPTEAEWEYASRAGSAAATEFGDRISSEEANFDGTFPYGEAAKGPYIGKTQVTGSYPPNAYGIFDMHGNVNEWCWDRYGAYKGEFQIDPSGPDQLTPSRVVRGGSWSDIGRFMRSAYRTGSNQELRNSQTGFRLARNLVK